MGREDSKKLYHLPKCPGLCDSGHGALETRPEGCCASDVGQWGFIDAEHLPIALSCLFRGFMGSVAPLADFIKRGHRINPTCVQDRKQFPEAIANNSGMPVDL